MVRGFTIPHFTFLFKVTMLCTGIYLFKGKRAQSQSYVNLFDILMLTVISFTFIYMQETR